MTEWLKVKAEDGHFDAYVARPEAATAPAVVVIQEIFGVNADLRATCHELAAKGFVAVSPDLFWRSIPGGLAREDEPPDTIRGASGRE